jgi:hypothetical protein
VSTLAWSMGTTTPTSLVNESMISTSLWVVEDVHGRQDGQAA